MSQNGQISMIIFTKKIIWLIWKKQPQWPSRIGQLDMEHPVCCRCDALQTGNYALDWNGSNLTDEKYNALLTRSVAR